MLLQVNTCTLTQSFQNSVSLSACNREVPVKGLGFLRAIPFTWSDPWFIFPESLPLIMTTGYKRPKFMNWGIGLLQPCDIMMKVFCHHLSFFGCSDIAVLKASGDSVMFHPWSAIGLFRTRPWDRITIGFISLQFKPPEGPQSKP